MPNIKSNEKSSRQDEKRRIFNSGEKAKLRTLVKKVRVAVNSKNKDAAVSEFNMVASALDKAAKRHIIHPNNAARRKARLAVMINKMNAE